MLATVFLLFCLLAVLILVERRGVMYAGDSGANSLFIPENADVSADVAPGVTCLLIYNSSEAFSKEQLDNIEFTLNEMRVGYTAFDTHVAAEMPSFEPYKTVIFSTIDYENVSIEFMYELFDWVDAGGGALFTNTIDNPMIISMFANRLGIKNDQWEWTPQDKCIIVSDFLAGAEGLELQWSNEDSFRFGGNYKLDDSCIVHIQSTGNEGETAMVWERALGNGTIIVNNNDAALTRWSRGLISAEYSLLEPIVAWPVINASVFFLDDFPAPVPDGYNEYVQRDYGTTMEYFFVNVWFPDMIEISSRYGIKYTGGLIETYEDNVTPPFSSNTAKERIEYFGKMLLNEGGEIAVHGYNHQSIVPVGYNYHGELHYKQWRNMDDAAEALSELMRFSNEVFPDNPLKSYIPPSNVLSVEGRQMIAERFPQINTIAGINIDNIFGGSDEFGIDKYGFITLPRVSSGFYIDDDLFWNIISEVNLHFVNTHFVHPDDVVDVDRGAEKGWEWLRSQYAGLISWISEFPLRNMTAQEGAGAVQRFDRLTLNSTTSDGKLSLRIGGFYDEAWLLVRINKGTPGEVFGGTLTNVDGNLYLLKADSSYVEISLDGV
jgi:hypothetical protein